MKSKRLKITLGINSLVATRYQAYSNHIQLFFGLGRNHPEVDIALVNPERMSIDRMRTLAADVALDTESDYLLFIDDDVLVPIHSMYKPDKRDYNVGRAHKHRFDWLDRLIACKADIAAGDVLIRGYPFNHMLFKFDRTKSGLLQMRKVPDPRGIIPVDAVGFSLALIKVDLLKRLSKPYFATGPNNTEDIYFCLKAWNEYPKVKIRANTTIQCAHLLWDEVISSDNKENYKKYFERQNPLSVKEDKEVNMRGREYLRVVQGIIDADAKSKKTA